MTTKFLMTAAAAVVIVGVLLQVLFQLVDVSGQQSDLDFGRASVLLGESDLGHNFLLVHRNSTSFIKFYLPAAQWRENGTPFWAYSQLRAAVTVLV